MKNDENILKQILAKLDSLEKGQANLEKGQASLEKGQANLEKGQANLEKGQAITNARLDEHYQILRALEHASTVHKADIDNLTHQVAGLSGEIKAVQKIQADHTEALDRIENKVAGHDVKIEVLDRTKADKRKVK